MNKIYNNNTITANGKKEQKNKHKNYSHSVGTKNSASAAAAPALIDVPSPKKLFVLSDPEFSPDMTQIVMQYTDLSMEESDFAAAIMDRDDSFVKQSLLNASLKF